MQPFAALHCTSFLTAVRPWLAESVCAAARGGVGGEMSSAPLSVRPPVTLPPPALCGSLRAGLRVCVHACMRTLSSSKCVRSTSFGLGGAGLLPAHRGTEQRRGDERRGGASVSNATHSPGQRSTQRTHTAHLSSSPASSTAVRDVPKQPMAGGRCWPCAAAAAAGSVCACGGPSFTQPTGRSGHSGRSRTMARTRAEERRTGGQWRVERREGKKREKEKKRRNKTTHKERAITDDDK